MHSIQDIFIFIIYKRYATIYINIKNYIEVLLGDFIDENEER